jgi:hypothetical protein
VGACAYDSDHAKQVSNGVTKAVICVLLVNSDLSIDAGESVPLMPSGRLAPFRP